MKTRIVLISEDSDFFEYVISMLDVRRSDEVFKFNFEELPEKIHLLSSSLVIVNSENKGSQTIELLKILTDIPVIVFGYNHDEEFKIKCYQEGMLSYFTPAISQEEFIACITSALKLTSSLQKNERYRDILVNNHLITQNNEVYLDCNNFLEREISKIHNNSDNAVLIAISPDEKTKFSIQSNQIETAILNNIRKNDLLINFAPNKYFLILYDTDEEKSKKLWTKISSSFSVPVYAGVSYIGNKSRQQIVNDVLNKLHNEMNKGFDSQTCADAFSGGTFKFFRAEFNKKIKQIISPVFYHIQQVYNERLFGMRIEQGIGEGYGVLYIKSSKKIGIFRITSPGFSTINIDIEIGISDNNSHSDMSIPEKFLDSKRISLEPEELESGLLQDLIEQFIMEFKREAENGNT